MAEVFSQAESSKAYSLPLGFHMESSRASFRGPLHVVLELNKFVEKVIVRMNRRFLWSSLQLNYQTASEWHVDFAPGLSLLVVAGDFSGGEFESVSNGICSLRNQAMWYDAKTSHRAQAHQGLRVSLVAFLHPSLGQACSGLLNQLTRAGFRAKDSDRLSELAPVRVVVSSKNVRDPDTVYIGRGSSIFGIAALEIGKSISDSFGDVQRLCGSGIQGPNPTDAAAREQPQRVRRPSLGMPLPGAFEVSRRCIVRIVFGQIYRCARCPSH